MGVAYLPKANFDEFLRLVEANNMLIGTANVRCLPARVLNTRVNSFYTKTYGIPVKLDEAYNPKHVYDISMCIPKCQDRVPLSRVRMAHQKRVLEYFELHVENVGCFVFRKAERRDGYELIPDIAEQPDKMPDELKSLLKEL